MQRYFVREISANQTFFLTKEDSYHIQKVMRMNISDQIEVVYDRSVYICEIIEMEPVVCCRVVSTCLEDCELQHHVVLIQSLVKEQKMDYILQKSTELGVGTIYPYQAERSVVKIQGKEDKKVARWNIIVKEASEQSKRNQIPTVKEVLTIRNLEEFDQFEYKFICTTNQKQENLKKVLSKLPSCATMVIVIGPEGGFTQTEEDTFMKAGFIPISLGKSVLRTETAGIFFLSVVRYIDME